MTSIKKRAYFTIVLFFIAFLAVFTKTLVLQVFNRDKLLARSKSQIFREVKVYPKRGNIVDRNGNPLALNIQTYSVFVIPKNLKSIMGTLRSLKKIIPELRVSKLYKKLKERKKFTWLFRKKILTDEQLARVKKLNGVYWEAVPKRIYPNHELAAPLLGFVGLDNKGLSGIEYKFDEKLRGKPHLIKYIIDNKGRPIKFESREKGSLSQDVALTIDKELQSVVEKALKDAVSEHDADGGGAGVMDARTGEILAMSNYPTFDPNSFQEYPAKHRNLSFISSPIEPGSTLKTLTVISALEHKIARSDTSYYCEKGQMKIDGHIISESDSNHKYEWLSVSDIIKYSSNIGTTKISFDLTYPRLKETLKKFRIGEKTNIQAPGESRGILTSRDNVRPLKLSNISFGQGVATTGVQMLSAYSAIANGGMYVSPKIILGRKADSERIFSEKTARDVTEMLLDAVEDGTGENAKVRYFRIAGKTSTAQRPDKQGSYSGYNPGFIGYPVNVKSPFVIYVYVENPKGKEYYGSQVAAPVFSKIARYILYKSKNVKKFHMASGKSLISSDKINTKSSSLKRDYGPDGMPNFVGLDRKSAIELLEKYELEAKHMGMGIVEKQSIEPGSPFKKSHQIHLNYTPPQYD